MGIPDIQLTIAHGKLQTMSNTAKHHGRCLCGDVQFEVELDLSKGSRCNCTMCTKLGAVGSIVKPAAFALLSPESSVAR